MAEDKTSREADDSAGIVLEEQTTGREENVANGRRAAFATGRQHSAGVVVAERTPSVREDSGKRTI